MKCNLLQSFYGLILEKGSKIVTYVSKLKNLAYRSKISDTMIVSKVLISLPEEYFVSA